MLEIYFGLEFRRSFRTEIQDGFAGLHGALNVAKNAYDAGSWSYEVVPAADLDAFNRSVFSFDCAMIQVIKLERHNADALSEAVFARELDAAFRSARDGDGGATLPEVCS